MASRTAARGAVAAAALVVVLASARPAFALKTWLARSPVPAVGAGVEGMAVGFVGRHTIVAAYGDDSGNGDTTQTRLYNSATDTWSAGPQAPNPARAEVGSVSVDNFLYVLGGRSDKKARALNNLNRFDAITNSWTTLPPMASTRAGVAVAATGGSLYAIGGRLGISGPCSGGELASVEKFDIATGTWSPVAPLPSARSDAGAAAIGGKVYVFGGCKSDPVTGATKILRRVDVYDPATNSWSASPANLPTAAAAFYGLAAIELPAPKIYVIGGFDGTSKPLGLTQIYRVASNTYAPGPKMITPRAEMGVALQNDEIFAVGGAIPAFGKSSNANEVLVT